MPIRYANRMDGVRASAIRELLKHGADPDLISFGGGYPSPDLFPVEELRAVYDDLDASLPDAPIVIDDHRELTTLVGLALAR